MFDEGTRGAEDEDERLADGAGTEEDRKDGREAGSGAGCAGRDEKSEKSGEACDGSFLARLEGGLSTDENGRAPEEEEDEKAGWDEDEAAKL